MNNYWDERFHKEGKIWGDAPSKTAVHAKELFLKNGIKTILVPGSGYGRHTELFASAGFEVSGIEISEEALKIAKESNPKIKYYSGSVLDMPFSNDIYDAIYCFNVVHLFRKNERELFLQKCLDQIKEKGFLFFVVFSDKETSFGKGTEVEKNTFESKLGRPVHYFTEEDLKEHFKNHNIIETGLVEDPENHGAEGPHTHLVRYVFVQK